MFSQVALVALAALPAAFAQCAMVALPAGTVTDTCPALGEDVADGTDCTVQCTAGQTPAEGSLFVYTCVGTEFTATAGVCEACAANFWKSALGDAACTACPDNSVNPELGSTLVTECICAAGASGEITGEGEGACDLCELSFYKTEIENGPCSPCPAESITEATGAVAVTLCLCQAGFVGVIEADDDVCTACVIGEYKEGVGPGECIPCTENADTALPGSVDITLCRCMPAHGRDSPIAGPEDTCDECIANTYKQTTGNTECLPCPEGETSDAAATQCSGSGGLSTGAVVGISAAAVLGVGAAFGGVMYGKSNYNRYRRESVNDARGSNRDALMSSEA